MLKYNKFIKVWLIPLGIAFILSCLIKIFLFRVVVPTDSMYPTIKEGRSLIATRIHGSKEIKRGDILVFYSKELKLTLIKRAIGLPGDKILIDDKGTVYINGKALDEKYVVKPGGKTGKFEVPNECYFFLGDNRTNSYDSRYWINPYINIKDIKAKARFIILPFKILK